jgi:HNH endonuclease
MRDQRAGRAQPSVPTATISLPSPRDGKDAVFLRDFGRCCCCGSDQHLEIDHFVPAHPGGSSDFDQLQTLCRACNSEQAINSQSGNSLPDDLTLAKQPPTLFPLCS